MATIPLQFVRYSTTFFAGAIDAHKRGSSVPSTRRVLAALRDPLEESAIKRQLPTGITVNGFFSGEIIASVSTGTFFGERITYHSAIHNAPRVDLIVPSILRGKSGFIGLSAGAYEIKMEGSVITIVPKKAELLTDVVHLLLFLVGDTTSNVIMESNGVVRVGPAVIKSDATTIDLVVSPFIDHALLAEGVRK